MLMGTNNKTPATGVIAICETNMAGYLLINFYDD